MSWRVHVLTLLVVAACGASSDDPRLLAIEPAVVTPHAATPAVLHGEQLDAIAHVDLDHERPTQLEQAWQVAIDDVALDASAVRWTSPTEIDLIVPGGLTIGTHDVSATSPGGQTVALPGGLMVIPGPAATLAIAPNTVDVVVGGAAVPFAVTAIDADGHPTTDLGTIAWSIETGAFGALDATGTLTPVLAGTGTIRATSSSGASVVTGAIVVRAPATLATAALAAPSSLAAYQSGTATLTITNAGQSPAANVVPCALTASGAGAIQIVSGPSPPSTAIAAGGTGTFAWTIAGAAQGQVLLTSCANGSDETTGAAAASPNASATVPVSPAQTLAATLTVPMWIGRATPFTVTMNVTNTGPATATGVMPSALAVSGTAAVALVTGAGTGASIAPNGIATFTWTYAASTLGTVSFSGTAAGADPSGSLVTPAAQSNVGTVVERRLVAVDPFGDGTAFAYVNGYRGDVLVGPDATGSRFVDLKPDGSDPLALALALPADTTGRTSSNTSAAPFSSLGYTGCAANQSCGPNNESGRGVVATGTIAGTEWLIAGGAHGGGGSQYAYLTTDTASPLSFRYVDLSSAIATTALGFTAIATVNDIVYLGAAASTSPRPMLVALATTPSAPGLDATAADASDLRADRLAGIAPGSTSRIDALAGFANRLYLANDGAWARATVATPRDDNAFPGDWAVITPTSSTYTGKSSQGSAKTADLTPADRAVPQMAAFGGRLFVGRNTTSGPQLWSCDPSRTGDPAQCDAGDWTHVAPNTLSCILILCSGDTKLTQFDDGSLDAITMVVATPSYLYVGFDGSNGVTVFRTANPAATAQGDFEGQGGCSAAEHGNNACDGYGGAGLGSATGTRILDAKAVTSGGATSVWVTTGDGSAPLSLVLIP